MISSQRLFVASAILFFLATLPMRCKSRGFTEAGTLQYAAELPQPHVYYFFGPMLVRWLTETKSFDAALRVVEAKSHASCAQALEAEFGRAWVQGNGLRFGPLVIASFLVFLPFPLW